MFDGELDKKIYQPKIGWPYDSVAHRPSFCDWKRHCKPNLQMSMNRIFLIIGLILASSHTLAGSDDEAETFIDLIIKDDPQLIVTEMQGESDTRKTYRVCDRDKCSYFTVRKYKDGTQVVYPH